MITPATLWRRFRRVIFLAACAGRTRDEAAHLLGVGYHTLGEEVRGAGFRRSDDVAPDPADVYSLLSFLGGDTTAAIRQREEELRRQHADQLADQQHGYEQRVDELRQRHLAHIRWLSARHDAERRRLEARIQSLTPIQTTDPRPWSGLTPYERQQRLANQPS